MNIILNKRFLQFSNIFFGLILTIILTMLLNKKYTTFIQMPINLLLYLISAPFILRFGFKERSRFNTIVVYSFFVIYFIQFIWELLPFFNLATGVGNTFFQLQFLAVSFLGTIGFTIFFCVLIFSAASNLPKYSLLFTPAIGALITFILFGMHFNFIKLLPLPIFLFGTIQSIKPKTTPILKNIV